eukprot:GHVT01042957.1.p3 GENE.GHVT01042957.1~~GHVT01042957.1.p3  ORF type:complete len:107 (+),score=19.39 GHVT01042957.1:1325-1645(+)
MLASKPLSSRSLPRLAVNAEAILLKSSAGTRCCRERPARRAERASKADTPTPSAITGHTIAPTATSSLTAMHQCTDFTNATSTQLLLLRVVPTTTTSSSYYYYYYQ